MLNTPRSRRGMVTSPHHLASEAGLRVLREGTAIEATLAMAASLPVVYPHMNSIGGDGFWLISKDGKAPIAVDGCGASGTGRDSGFLQEQRAFSDPPRGPLAANTVRHAVGLGRSDCDQQGDGWQAAHLTAGGRCRMVRRERIRRNRNTAGVDRDQAVRVEGLAGLCRNLPAGRQASEKANS